MNNAPQTVDELEDHLSQPSDAVIEMFSQMAGDVIFLGVGGKMGPTMARMARRASDAAGTNRRVIGVSRFSNPDLRQRLESWDVETIACDLLDAEAVNALPAADHVIYMSGMKFGSSGAAPLTWAMNCYAPSLVARKYRDSRIAAFSTGNVYGMVPADGSGSVETDSLHPDGEYAITTMGRERIFEYFSETLSLPVAIIRLNYATELRYGVLVDIAQQVFAGRPVDVTMNRVNVIWLRDANAMTLLSLERSYRRQTVEAAVESLANSTLWRA